MRDSDVDRGAKKTPARWSETEKGKTMNGIGRRAFVAGSAALLRRGRQGSGRGLSGPAGHLHHPVSAGRQHHHRGALGQRPDRRVARPAGRDRQPRRRRRHGRHQGAGEEPSRTATRSASAIAARLAIGPNLYSNPGYDPRKDFAAVGRIATAPNTLVVHPSFPAKNVAELVAYAKANPGKVNYGSAGVGTVSHICGEYFANAAGIKLVHVPYKGTGPALIDLIGGHIPVAFAPIPATYENSKKGVMRMLAVTSAQRSTLAPEIPTIAEQGVPGFEAVLRYGVIAPAGTPAPIIARLNKALNDALAGDDIRKRLALEGAEPLPSTPAEYAADIDREERE